MTRWISVDWADNAARGWVLDAAGDVVGPLSGPGALGLAGDGFEPALAQMIADHLDDEAPIDIFVAGAPALAGRWVAAEPRSVPCEPPSLAELVTVSARDDRMRIRLVSGVSQAKPAGILLGDGLRVAGFLAETPKFDGVICLSGARTHWVHVSAGEIVSFQSALTMRIAENILAALGVERADQVPGDAFFDALDDTMTRPESLAQKVGTAEAAYRQGQIGVGDLNDLVMGGLLGLELAATRPYWLGQRVALVAGEGTEVLYHAALDKQGLFPERHGDEAVTLAGFKAIKNSL